jgi:hypothetical protein
MPIVDAWSKWMYLFLHGKTYAIYAQLGVFAYFFLQTFFVRNGIYPFTVNFIGSLFAFGLLVDLVSHLFNNGTKSDLSNEQFLDLFKNGRTHDLYGCIILIAAGGIDLLFNLLSTISIALVLAVTYLIVKARFYH